MRSIALLLVVAIVTGCASITSGARTERFDKTALAYERALRWSDFRTAFALTGNIDAPVPDLQRLENIRVTSYDVVGAPQVNADASRVVQLVEIRYVSLRNMAERVLADRQTWSYVEKDQRWKLDSAFPAFP